MERYRPDPVPVDATAVEQVAAPAGADAAPRLEDTAPTPSPMEAGGAAVPTDDARFLGEPDPGTITVETDLYITTFTRTGGVLVGWRGKQFPGLDDSEFVELVPERTALDPAPRGDALIFESGTVDLTDAPFTGGDGFRLAEGDAPRELVLTARLLDGAEIRKILTFTPGDYALGVRYEVSPGDSGLLPGEPVSARFVWNQGIAVTEKAMKMMMHGNASDRAFALVGEEYHAVNASNLGKDNGSGFGSFRGSVRYAGVQSKYFTILCFAPDAAERAFEGRIRLGGDPETGRQSWEIELPLTRAGSGASAEAALYAGPSDFNGLKSYGVSLERTVSLGWKWIQPISELVLHLMTWLHKFIPNYGWVIVIISILSKLIFWPLTQKGTQSMRKMQESQARLKPKMDALKKKHGGDAQKYNQEMMKLYKEEGVNPMAGMAGCLPMLIQMPIFFALYQVLYNMVDLRMAPWMLWIGDLSQPDALFLLPFSLPLLGSSFNLLPLVMAAATFFQTKLQPQGGAGGQMAMMNNIMPIMMLFFLYNMPSGLVIYWTINTAMTALQSWLVKRDPLPVAGGAEA
jgi:YidC/Oxa1 family membrane protein insertase